MATYDLTAAAQRSAVSPDDLRRLVEERIVTPDDEGRFTSGDLRRAGLVSGLIGGVSGAMRLHSAARAG